MKLFFPLFVASVAFFVAGSIASAATVTYEADTTISLPNGITLTLIAVSRVEQLVINDTSTISLTLGSDSEITFQSANKYDLAAPISSDTAQVFETCESTFNELRIKSVAASGSVTVSVDSSKTCSGSSSNVSSSGGGGGGGGGLPAPVTSGSGSTLYSIGIGESRSIGTLSTGGANLLMFINSQAQFTSRVSSGASEVHSATISDVDLSARKITITFQSSPTTLTLELGESDLVDLDDDGQNDIKVTFNKFNVNEVDLTISLLSSVIKEAGDLVKLACGENAGVDDPCRAVYYIGNDGKRYVFPNQKTYLTWYDDFSSVKIVTSESLAAYPIGGNVTYRPGVKMVKITTDPKVYAVASNGALRWVTSESIASVLYGANWGQMVEDVPDPFFVNYSIGADVTEALQYDTISMKGASPDINRDKGL